MELQNIINEILATTPDPVLLQTAQDMAIKHTVSIEGHRCLIHLSAGFPIQLLRHTWLPRLEVTLQKALPDHEIQLTLDQFIKAHRTQMPGKGLRGVKNTIAIASGKGGVGKSTITVNIAAALQQLGARVGILDADIYGPSIPTMLGQTDEVKIENDRYHPILAHDIQAMSIGYLTHEENSTLIWRGPMLAKALLQMLDITLWDDLDYLLIDLPPGTGDIQLSLVQKIPLTGAIVVTTPQQVATLDADKAINLFEKTNIHVLGVIENMAMHYCTHCGHPSALFGEGGALALCHKHGCELLGQLSLDPRIVQDSDQGTPTALRSSDALTETLKSIALKTAMAINQQPINYADKFPPVVTE